MDTRFKLEEARYFLGQLIETQDDPKLSYFYLSAFLSAWRSVLDVMLCDFVEHYPLRLAEKSELKITDRDFWVAANALKHAEALRFIEWWRQKADIVRKHRLSKERNRIVHKEYPPRIVYAPSTLSSGSGLIVSGGEVVGIAAFTKGAFPVTTAVVPGITIEIKFPDLLGICNEGFVLMEEIVKEAEEKFGIPLT